MRIAFIFFLLGLVAGLCLRSWIATKPPSNTDELHEGILFGIDLANHSNIKTTKELREWAAGKSNDFPNVARWFVKQ